MITDDKPTSARLIWCFIAVAILGCIATFVAWLTGDLPF